MRVIYLAAGRAKLEHNNVTYNDIKEKRDLNCDMLAVNLKNYDVLIATPPCNYYSRANNSGKNQNTRKEQNIYCLI